MPTVNLSSEKNSMPQNVEPSLHDVLEVLNHGAPTMRAKYLKIISSKSNPNIELGATSLSELLLIFCDDGDARVRASALSCLCSWTRTKKGDPKSKRKLEWISDNWSRVYVTACRLITEDSSLVRQVSLETIYNLGLRFPKQEAPLTPALFSRGLMEHASLDYFTLSLNAKHIHQKKVSSLADDSFSRICDRLQDPSRHVRQLAASLVADLAQFVAEESLMSTLEKTVMSDRQVKRSTTEHFSKEKVELWGTVAPGCRSDIRKSMFDRSSNAPVSVGSISLFSTGSSGALINGLEDEFHEVRCATLATVTKIATCNTTFASVCQDLLVDMLTDDIHAVRLLAVRALQAVGDQVPILNDQIAIVTSALAEGSALMRQRLHQLLGRCRLVSPPCLLSLLDGLLLNLRRYPDDRSSIWRCAAQVGKNHPAFVEVCISILLRTHSWLSDQEPSREDPAYITVLLLVLNAQPGAPGMSAHFPRHLVASNSYLRELVPHLLPKQVPPTPANRFSIDLSPAFKRRRLDVENQVVRNVSETQSVFHFMLSTLILIRRLLLESLELLSSYQASTTVAFGPKQQDLYKCSLSLARVVGGELRLCHNWSQQLGDLPILLDYLATASWCLLSAAISLQPNGRGLSTFTSSPHPRAVSEGKSLQQRVTMLLKRALRLILKSEHLFLGFSDPELCSVREIGCTVFFCLTVHGRSSHEIFIDLHKGLSKLVNLFDTLFGLGAVTSSASLSGSLSEAFLSDVAKTADRIRKISILVIHPPLSGGADHLSATEDYQSLPETEARLTKAPASLPEVRFSAILATAAISIKAIVSGLSLQAARDRVRVLYRRPDSACSQTPNMDHRGQRVPLLTYHPPPLSWRVFESPTDDSSVDLHGQQAVKSAQLPQLELLTTLELTAPCWTDAATLEIDFGLCVSLKTTTEGLTNTPDESCASQTVISLLPNNMVARIKLLPVSPLVRR